MWFILTYLSSIRASRLAWPHLRLWSLLEHFLVITNPARNPRRRETMAVLRQATDNVFSEYCWDPPGKSKKWNCKYFLCLEMMRTVEMLFILIEMFEGLTLKRRGQNVSGILGRSDESHFLVSWFLTARGSLANLGRWNWNEKDIKVGSSGYPGRLEGWRGVWQIQIFGQFAANKNNIMWGLQVILSQCTVQVSATLIKMFSGKCLPEYEEEDEPHPEWNPPAMFCSKELASTRLPWCVWHCWVWMFQAQ